MSFCLVVPGLHSRLPSSELAEVLQPKIASVRLRLQTGINESKKDCLVLNADPDRMRLRLSLVPAGCPFPPYTIHIVRTKEERMYLSVPEDLPPSEAELDYFYCEDCVKYFRGMCSEHPLLLICDATEGVGARVSLPDFLQIRHSSIPSAGDGVWTSVDIPVGIAFGPYVGKCVHERSLADKTGYSWELRHPDGSFTFVDGSDESVSNWIRYINCSRTEDEQNLIAFQLGPNIYYRVFKAIPAETELLVWYGDDYGATLTGAFTCSNKKLSRIKTV